MKIIIANLKMNPCSEKEAEELFRAYQKDKEGLANLDLFVAPPFLYLQKAKDFGLQVVAQNCFYENQGAYTGEISPLMLKDLGVKGVILGHSERRALGETEELIARKVRAVLKEGLIPILCVGEKKEEREKGLEEEVVKSQLKKIFENYQEEIRKLIIAYEPVWAIGTGQFCDPQEAKRMQSLIKEFLLVELQLKISELKILYGGSVDSLNISLFLGEENIDGALVGGASLKKEEFGKILKIANSF